MSAAQYTKGDKPGFIALLVFAALAAMLAVMWASSGDWGLAVGFAIFGIAQVVMAFRARRRDKAAADRSTK
jgi:ABC-type antimicrobial peptide transport system permease subunit